jgi:AAT family amino acid transporter
VLIAVLITMGLDKEVWGISWIVGVPWIALLSIFYFMRRANRARNAAGTPIEEPRP